MGKFILWIAILENVIDEINDIYFRVYYGEVSFLIQNFKKILFLNNCLPFVIQMLLHSTFCKFEVVQNSHSVLLTDCFDICSLLFMRTECFVFSCRFDNAACSKLKTFVLKNLFYVGNDAGDSVSFYGTFGQ